MLRWFYLDYLAHNEDVDAVLQHHKSVVSRELQNAAEGKQGGWRRMIEGLDIFECFTFKELFLLNIFVRGLFFSFCALALCMTGSCSFSIVQGFVYTFKTREKRKGVVWVTSF